MSSDDSLSDSYEESYDESTKGDILSDLKPIDLNKFTLIKKIGANAFGELFLIKENATDQPFAAREIRVSDDIGLLKEIYKEIEFLHQISQFNSPFLIKFNGYSLKNFKGDSNPIIITEYQSNGSLSQLLQNERRGSGNPEFTSTKRLIFIYGIAYGMAILHKNKIVHRNLKPTNILINDYFHPVIDDFALATKEDDIEPGEKGTLLYMAPEIMLGEKYDKSVDVFSFAIIVYEIITGLQPYSSFRSINPMKLMSLVTRGERPQIPDYIHPSYKNLMEKCWDQDPGKRPSFEEIVKFLSTDEDLISTLDEYEYLDFIESPEFHYSNLSNTEKDDPRKKPSSKLPPLNKKKNDDSPKRPKFNFNKVHINYQRKVELLVDVDPIDISKYQAIQFIGEGSFGNVFKIIHIKTKKEFAAKINKIELEFCKPNEIKNLEREITNLSKISSPTILRFIGYNLKNFKGESNPTIITELSVNEDLSKIIELQVCSRTPDEWTSTISLITVYGIAYGMSYLHSNEILHRDLKPANVFYDEFLHPKIGDLGLSKEVNAEPSEIGDVYQIGTPAFMSPEIFIDSRYCKASDVYAFGILLYQMKTLKEPFCGMKSNDIYEMVINGGRPAFDFDISPCYRKLIERCWAQKEEDRPTFDEIVNQLENDPEFITDDVDENDFLDYIDYVKNNKTTKSFKSVSVDFEELKRIQRNDPTLNVSFLELKEFEKKKILRRFDNYKIYDIVNIKTQQHYEGKVSTILITKLSRKDLIHLEREINILSKLNHPSFLKFIGYSPIDFNQIPYPVIVTEMPPNQSLNDLLDYERDDEEHIDEWNATKKLINIFGIASGMAYLHSNNVIHRNLDPKSIFLDDYLFPKIGNFGLLTKIHTLATMTNLTTCGVKGNPSYSSPEILQSYDYSKQSDVYAFALIVYEIMTLRIPFYNINNYNTLINEIVNKGTRPPFNDKIPNCYRQLIEVCWSQNPSERPTFEEITSVLKNEKEFITEDVNQKEFEQYVEFIEKSKIEFYSANKVVKFDDLIKMKEEKQKQKQSKSESKIMPKTKKVENKSTIDDDDDDPKEIIKSMSVDNQFDQVYDDLLNKKFIGSIKKELYDYLFQNSDTISTSAISSDYKVIIGKSTSDNDYILIKTFDNETVNKTKFNKLSSLYQTINDIHHPNIVKCLGFYAGNESSLLFEYYSRKLTNVIESIDDVYLITLIYEIAHVMMIVHSKKMIHRNLNIDNIFVDFDNHAKIANFGNSIVMDVPGLIDHTNDLKPCCLSRELLKNEKYNEKVDVFAFGMIMQFILQRGKRRYLKREDIIEGKIAKIPKFINRLSFSILKGCLSASPDQRPVFKAIVHTIKKFKFGLIDGIDDKIPLIEKHLKPIINKRASK